jgi:hypothetical protein
MFSPRLFKTAATADVLPEHRRANGQAPGIGLKETPVPAAVAHSEAGDITRQVGVPDFGSIRVFPSTRKPSFAGISEQLGVREDSVRVRSDRDAVEFLDDNRAVAAAMDASTIYVRPEHTEDEFVMSHELVHIAQLRHGFYGSLEGSEHGAHVAGMNLMGGHVPASIGSAAPPPLFLRLSEGAFGQALDNAGVSDKVVALLKKSSSFMHIVDTLDKHYVWLHDPSFRGTNVDLVHGVVNKGPFGGRRVLYIQGGAAAGSFTPFDSPDATIGGDLIKINNGGTDLEVVRTIAHEATHAFREVTGTASTGEVEAAIQAGITEELETRKSEVKVAESVYGPRSAERRAVQEDVAAGYLSRPVIERDIAPDIGLSYLEASGFDALLSEAQRKENLSDLETADIRKRVDTGNFSDPKEKSKKRFPMQKGSHGFDEPSRYALIYVNRKMAIATWEKFRQEFHGREDSPEAVETKERLLQENAHVLLDGRIKYSPLPRK